MLTSIVHRGGGGGGGRTTNQIFKKGAGLTGPQPSEGGCWEREGDFRWRGLQFSHKNKLKSETFNDKKSL